MKKVMKVIAAGIVCTCIFCFGKAIRDKTTKVYQQFCEETEPEEIKSGYMPFPVGSRRNG